MSGESSVRELRATGLQGVSLGETEIALVDGENGRLIYRGHDAEQLAHESTFEATAFLLWNGRLPDDAELADLRRRAVAGMVVPSEVHDAIRALGDTALPMDVLRTGLSFWGAMRARAEGGDSEDALWALAAMPAIVADYARLRSGEAILAPDPELGIVENYLLKLSGERPEAAQARALDAYFILGAEHGMNASTFTARVIVSTLSDLASGLVGAVAALKGPLHGGAPSHVSHMIDEIGTPENAEPWLRNKLEAGEVLMGFGHRVYRTYDPARVRSARWPSRSPARTSASPSPATSRRSRCGCWTSTSRAASSTRTSSTTRPSCSAASRCRPTSTRRRSLPPAPRAGRRTSSSSCSTTA